MSHPYAGEGSLLAPYKPVARNKPSPEFFIRQAVLNAALDEWDWLDRPELNPRRLARLTLGAKVLPPWFHAKVCHEFRKLQEAWA